MSGLREVGTLLRRCVGMCGALSAPGFRAFSPGKSPRHIERVTSADQPVPPSSLSRDAMTRHPRFEINPPFQGSPQEDRRKPSRGIPPPRPKSRVAGGPKYPVHREPALHQKRARNTADLDSLSNPVTRFYPATRIRAQGGGGRARLVPANRLAATPEESATQVTQCPG